MKKAVVILVLVLIASAGWAQTAERYTSIVLIFNLKVVNETQMQDRLDSFMFRGYSIASTEIYGDYLYVFLQARF